ncbi:MAG: Gfo/Idh/MocA family oxidoreductase [Bacillota bacterium]|jgi:predicted dehydrogenase|nr:Gfo/Idh/MocA family oxidoreductase [Bacillota bacterium]
MLKIGIIGCGKIAQVRHIPEYSAHEQAEIVAYYDKTLDRAQAMAEKYGGKAYETLDELLANEEIDAVSVCIANHMHAEVTIRALNSGKHVLCEKPMATSMEDCEAMVETAERVGKKLVIGHNQILTAAHRRAKELIDQGLIGDILTFRTTFGHGGPEAWSIDPGPGTWFFKKEAAVFGAMADLGVHKLYLLRYLTGQRYRSVSARFATLHKRNAQEQPIKVEDNAICILEMENGIMGSMTASWTYYGAEDNSTVLYGTEGILKIYDDPNFAMVAVLKGGERICFDLEGIQTNVSQTRSGVIDEFIAVILEGKESELSGRRALDAMRAIFAASESARENKTVFIEN